jgi:hypothetical protein
MNAIENGIKDADHDYKMGVKNIALSSGVKVKGHTISIPNGFKAFSLGIRFFSVALLFSPYLLFDYTYSVWQLGILALAIVIVLYFSVKLLSIHLFKRNTIRKYIAAQSFIRYALVPLMLLPMIGIQHAIVLILFPVIWYIVFASLIKEKLFRPRM